MKTQLEHARSGKVTPVMIAVARSEGVKPEKVRREIARGYAVVPANPIHCNSGHAIVGRAFRTKVNANIGRSTERSSSREEILKLKVALSAGADFVMDLSVGPDLSSVRKSILAKCNVPLGTVPIYEALSLVEGDVGRLDEDLLLSVIKKQAAEGVDFMTIHAGLLKRYVSLALKRVMGIVSRGGSILAEWMIRKNRENPFFSQWDKILEICARHDVTISLGDGLRPGCLSDASDKAQFAELKMLGKLVLACRRRGVQVMVEGPGHVPFDQIKMNMEREQIDCYNAPFYVLGPVVTDIAPGYDHITCAIGATAAAYYGASLLCYVTPAEHLGLPTADDVRAGVIASCIAAHAADVARNLRGARDRDNAMARARMNFDWSRQFELALDGETARKRYEQTKSKKEKQPDHCSMCGRDFCAVRATKRLTEMSGIRSQRCRSFAGIK
ncbi:MAG: phosphomethylpyrimidine synthase ThiC [Kiritimatiellae bacterium]|nr:phosphomethylpyrimidine synthase ThiC [Kiritimatiellia bacterium]MDD5520010.1 phosphomethylpyrimidine synthase ThiC [Kiritimatiellia bacterium]